MRYSLFNKCKTRISQEKGAAVVEFALVVPLLLLLVFGIIEFSILFYDKAVITNASREVAREFAIYSPTAPTQPQLEVVLNQYTQDRMINLDESTPPSLVTTPDPPEGRGPATQYVTATINYTYDFVFLPGLVSDLLPAIDLSAETTMRYEGFEP